MAHAGKKAQKVITFKGESYTFHTRGDMYTPNANGAARNIAVLNAMGIKSYSGSFALGAY